MSEHATVLVLMLYLVGGMVVAFGFGWATCRDVAHSKAVRELKTITEQLRQAESGRGVQGCAFSETFIDLSEHTGQREE